MIPTPATENTVRDDDPENAGTEPTWQAPAQPTEPDPRLADAVGLARDAAAEEAGQERVGEHVGSEPEDGAVTHLFAAELPGYRGWRWAVTVAHGGSADTPVTVSEVVLLPGPDALVGQEWVPWSERVQAGDLGVGDVVLTPADDERLVAGYLDSGDPQVDEVNDELGIGRPRVLSREGRLEAARRWKGGEFGPRSDMARGAAEHCGTCGFYVQLGGSLRAAFGACTNEISPADGRVVHAEYGCGAHSEAEVDTSPAVPVAGLVYDDAQLDIEARVDDPGDTEQVTEPVVAAESTVDTEPAVQDEPVAVAEPVEHEAPVGVAESAAPADDVAALAPEAAPPAEPEPVVVAESVVDTPASEESTVDPEPGAVEEPTLDLTGLVALAADPEIAEAAATDDRRPAQEPTGEEPADAEVVATQAPELATAESTVDDEPDAQPTEQ